MAAHTRRNRGVTLVEVMIVVAIIATIAAMAGSFFVYGTGRARLNNAAFEVSSMLSVAQIRASSTGVPQYAVFFESGGNAGMYLLERADAVGPIDWTMVDVTNDAAVGGNMRDRMTLARSDTAAINFAPLDPANFPGGAVPAPFTAISLTPASASSPLSQACSFCTFNGGITRGVIRFNEDGTVRMLTGGSQVGGVIAFTPNTDQRNLMHRFVVISAPSGISRVF
ncbi:prepilin-type N-terminal cleavage/methylation domain-containing protein [Myxococcaceae bacterium GXIMD 01537]